MTARLVTAAVISLVMSLVLGCASWPDFVRDKPVPEESREDIKDLIPLLRRYDYFINLPPSLLTLEYDNALSKLEADSDTMTELETLLLYALLGGPRKGSKQIRAVVKRFEDDGDSEELACYRGVVRLANMILSQQRENERLRIRLNEEKEYAEKLAYQLNELKNIEKIIFERENFMFKNK